MYGAKATSALFNTVARQGVLAKQLTAPKSTAFLSQLPTRHVSGKISYTTTTRSTQFSQKPVQQQQQQEQSVDDTHVPPRTTPWLGGKTLLDPAQVDVCILNAAKLNDSKTVISTFVKGKSSAGKEALPLSSQTYEAVIKAYGELRRHNQSLKPMMEAYKQMIDSGVRPSSQTYATIIRFLCTRDTEVQRTVSMLRRQAARTGNAVDSLPGLENEGNLEQAMAIFKQAVNEKCTDDFDVDLYNRILHSLSHKGNTENGIYILNQLERASHAKPNGATFASLMSMFGVAGDLSAVKECFMEYISMQKKLPSHDYVYVYNALVSAHVDAGDLDGALNIVQNIMIRDKVNVSISPYNKIVRRACYEGKLDMVEPLLGKLESDPSLPKPDASTYAAVLSAHIRNNDLDSASKVYERLITLDISKEYGHMADYAYACNNNEQPDLAIKVIQDMILGGLRLDVTLCEKVLNTFVNSGKTEEAIESLNTIMGIYAKNHFIDANFSLTTFALDFTAKCHNFKQALDILQILKKYSIGPNNAVSDAVLSMYKENKANPDQWEQTTKYLTNMSFSVLFDAAFRKQSNPEEFCKTVLGLCDDMTAVGIPLIPSLYIRVLTRMKKYGVTSEYEALWVEKFAPHLPNTNTAPTTAQDIIKEASPENNNRVTVDSDLLTGKALAKTLDGQYEEAIQILKDEIISNGDIPTADAVRDMIQGCTKAGRLDAVTEIYNTVIDSIKRLEKYSRQRALTTIYNAMIVSHARLDGLAAAKVFYNEIRHLGAYPSGDAYGTLLQCSPQENQEDCTEALIIYEEAKKNKVTPTVYFYNVLMSKFSKARRLENVLDLLKEMEQNGILPNSITYSTVISAALRCGKDDVAADYYQIMTSSKRYRPRSGPFASFIQFYVQQQPNREKALHYYHLSQQHKLKLPEHTVEMLKQDLE